MGLLKAHKVVSALPDPLEADAVYFVRVGSGFDLYVTNSLGTVVAYALNQALTLSLSSVPVAFTDGDCVKRVSIADAAVSPSTKIQASLQRPNTDEADDVGYFYQLNVVKVYAGGFDVLVVCSSLTGDDMTENPPSETITLNYLRG
jgi:hypothetical protein